MTIVIDFDAIDFFRHDDLLVDPYPYFEFLRSQCPVTREPHHDVTMITGYEEVMAVYNDAETFSVLHLGDRTVPDFRCRWRATTSAT